MGRTRKVLIGKERDGRNKRKGHGQGKEENTTDYRLKSVLLSMRFERAMD